MIPNYKIEENEIVKASQIRSRLKKGVVIKHLRSYEKRLKYKKVSVNIQCRYNMFQTMVLDLKVDCDTELQDRKNEIVKGSQITSRLKLQT